MGKAGEYEFPEPQLGVVEKCVRGLLRGADYGGAAVDSHL